MTQESLFAVLKTRESLSNDIWRACDILRRDNNCGGIMEYVEHLAWLLFLRFLDAQEEIWAAEAALSGRLYERILNGDLRWSTWARKDWKADELLPFVHGRLIPYLAKLSGSPVRDTIASIFSERNVVVCASPYNLRDVLAFNYGLFWATASIVPPEPKGRQESALVWVKNVAERFGSLGVVPE